MSSNIRHRHRPIFDDLSSDENKFQAAMAEYNALKDAGEDGLDFANKTAMWIAFERDIETQRDDALFKDPLAKHFVGEYGQRLSDAMSFGLAFSCFDPPGANIGLGLEGHVMYTAARTELINVQMDRWFADMSDCQVINLGAGMDTRVYWQESLEKSKAYWEIDAASVLSYKQKILDNLQKNGELPPTTCNKKAISMDFSNESIADLPSQHGYDKNTPTCWIVEGLIMYLNRADNEQLLDNVSELSASKSFLILNFSENLKGVPDKLSIDEIDKRLHCKGWTKTERLMFGEDGFNFGRYPEGKPANQQLGFAMYKKD